MFSSQFCICFYLILYVCHCHFGTINENCTQKNVIKLENNLDIKKRREELNSENNTKVTSLAKNVSKIFVGITIDNQQQTTTTTKKYNRDNRVKIVIQKKIKVTQNKKVINNIGKGFIKKNYSIFGIALTLYDLVVKKQFDTNKITNTDYYLENSIDKKNQNELIEDTGELTNSKNDTVEEQITIIENENITENVRNIFQNNSMDKIVPKDEMPKNIKNNDLTKNVYKYDSPKNVKPRSELIEDTGAFIVPKNDTVEEHSTMIKNENTIENMAKIFQNNGIDKNVPKYILSENTKTNDSAIPVLRIVNSVNSPEFTIPKSDTVAEQRTIIKNNNITENVTKIFQNNGIDKNKNVQNHKSPKNVQKRDIGIPEHVANNYMPEVFPNHDAKKIKYDLPKKIENYDMPENIHYNSNDVKPYQNDEINYKNIIYEKDVLIKKDNHTRRFDDNSSQNIRPQLQTRLKNYLVKKSLDEFKMVRRKTHYTMPDFEFKNDIAQRDIDVAYPKFREYDNEGTLNRARYHIMPDYHDKDIRNNMYSSYSELNHIYQSYEDYFKELNEILTRQKKIIRQIKKNTNKPKLTEAEKKKRQEERERRQQEKIRREQDQLDFDLLMSEVKLKQEKHRKLSNYTKFTFEPITAKTTPKSTTTAKPTTILTLFDETEVRIALKNDPHVKRILKMANLKREKYLNNIRRYLTDHNYTHDMNLAAGVNRLRTEATKRLS